LSSSEVPFRMLPELSGSSGFFWTAGERGELRFLRCQDCGHWIHPPQPICPADHAKHLEPEVVSGRATVATFTINHQAWMPGPELPYVVAIVEIEEDPAVRLTTNIVNIEPTDVHIGMPVRVVFEHHADPGGDVWIPLFEPDPEPR
jgi:uncharacterized OB-fold protein